ncbi:Mannosyl-oligosaccharide 1,2-alpha-mannosidase MNS3 [Smittium culicis]|uniref:Mannosyl-oligosaccharide 1,2-alpha-mannosidase MNS3 n=1 Tax=Smittium culicis TaxID=133412 RepID=A0A1R1Y1L4_9FUNG|nr:Mannosyl-oligosaccharide 1,2-alpha-mannosidase MNS3 [Smittium culicis]
MGNSKLIIGFISVYLMGGAFFGVFGEDWKSLGIQRPIFQQNNRFYDKRRTAVRNSMKHAWEGYRKYAFGKDELLPVTKKWSNK